MFTNESGQYPVTMNALIKRINRKLAADDRVLKVSRGVRTENNFGPFYVINWRHNLIVDHHIDPVEYGRELGALFHYETVVD
jgi:hypothetical protein